MKKFIILIIIFAGIGYWYFVQTQPEKSVNDSVNFNLFEYSDNANTTNNEEIIDVEIIDNEILNTNDNIEASEITDNEIQTEPNEAEIDKVIVSDNIRVSSPEANAVLNSPFKVVGEARLDSSRQANVFEGTVNIRITNLDGVALISEVANARASEVGEFGPFSITLNYQFSNTKEGYVEVYSIDVKDGKEINLDFLIKLSNVSFSKFKVI